MRTTPGLSSLGGTSTAFVPSAKTSSGSTEPSEYPIPTDTVPFDCSPAELLVSSVASWSTVAPLRLTAPRPVVKYVVLLSVVIGRVRVLNFHVDQRWPSPSPSFEDPSRRKEAVATTGTLATVSDMQSSTSAEMITGMPPRLMMYAACTSETIVVTTSRIYFRFCVREKQSTHWK